MKIDVDCPGCGKRYEVDGFICGKEISLQAVRNLISDSVARAGQTGGRAGKCCGRGGLSRGRCHEGAFPARLPM